MSFPEAKVLRMLESSKAQGSPQTGPRRENVPGTHSTHRKTLVLKQAEQMRKSRGGERGRGRRG